MNLNPFDLRGPEFLLFYGCLMAITAGTLVGLRRVLESRSDFTESDRFSEIAQDPYQIAFLRGGYLEVVRTAMVSLMERGMVAASGASFVSLDGAAIAKTRRALDKAILTRLGPPGAKGTSGGVDAESLLSDAVILAEAEQVGEPLQRLELIPGPNTKAQRLVLLLIATGLLWLVAGAKIQIALARGRTNLGILIMLALATPFLFRMVLNSRLTERGKAVLVLVSERFAGLLARGETLRSGATSSELTFLVAAYGMVGLPVFMGAQMAPFDQAARRMTSPTAGSSDGSSCSSASSCSGGSSCGGGGGCGGCGS